MIIVAAVCMYPLFYNGSDRLTSTSDRFRISRVISRSLTVYELQLALWVEFCGHALLTSPTPVVGASRGGGKTRAVDHRRSREKGVRRLVCVKQRNALLHGPKSVSPCVHHWDNDRFFSSKVVIFHYLKYC